MLDEHGEPVELKQGLKLTQVEADILCVVGLLDKAGAHMKG